MKRTTNGQPDDCHHELIKDEMFSVEETQEQGAYTLINVRIDYQHRGIALEHMCLYDYVSTIYRRKSLASDRNYLDAIENGSKRTVRAVS